MLPGVVLLALVIPAAHAKLWWDISFSAIPRHLLPGLDLVFPEISEVEVVQDHVCKVVGDDGSRSLDGLPDLHCHFVRSVGCPTIALELERRTFGHSFVRVPSFDRAVWRMAHRPCLTTCRLTLHCSSSTLALVQASAPRARPLCSTASAMDSQAPSGAPSSGPAAVSHHRGGMRPA